MIETHKGSITSKKNQRPHIDIQKMLRLIQEYTYQDQNVLRPKRVMLQAKKMKKKTTYRHIIQNILRLIQKYAYPDQNVLIKNHKGYVTSKNKTKKKLNIGKIL